MNNGSALYKEKIAVADGIIRGADDDDTMQTKKWCDYTKYLDTRTYTCELCPSGSGTINENEQPTYCTSCGDMWNLACNDD